MVVVGPVVPGPRRVCLSGSVLRGSLVMIAGRPAVAGGSTVVRRSHALVRSRQPSPGA